MANDCEKKSVVVALEVWKKLKLISIQQEKTMTEVMCMLLEKHEEG